MHCLRQGAAPHYVLCFHQGAVPPSGGIASIRVQPLTVCCAPGALQVVADLRHLDEETYGMLNDPINRALRRYAGMALTNLTFGDVANKVGAGYLCLPLSGMEASVRPHWASVRQG